MSNIILLKSSILCGLIQLIFIFLYISINFNYCLFVLTGILTSIFNHGLTFNFIKYLDRITMYIGYLLNIIILIKMFNFIMIFILNMSVVFYILSKHLNYSFIHVISHIMIAYINIHIISNLSYLNE